MSVLNDYTDEDCFIKESLLGTEVEIEVSVSDPGDELNDGDTYSITIDLSELIEEE